MVHQPYLFSTHLVSLYVRAFLSVYCCRVSVFLSRTSYHRKNHP